MFGHVNESVEDRGRLLVLLLRAHISGGALLVALVAGEAAVKSEEMDKEKEVGEVCPRKVFEPKGVIVPPPLEVMSPMRLGLTSS